MRVFWGFQLALLLLSTTAQARVWVDRSLYEFAQGRTRHATTTIIVLFSPTADDLRDLAPPRRYQRADVVNYLKQVADRAMRQAYETLKNSGILANGAIRCGHVFWINASLSCTVTPEGLKAFMYAPGVAKIYPNGKLQRVAVQSIGADGPRPASVHGLPYNLADIQLDRLRKEFPQLTGRGVLLGHIDSGVDGRHPGLTGRVRSFYDLETKRFSAAFDPDGHGTLTLGPIVGRGKDGTPLGIAPEAQVLVAGPTGSFETLLAGMEYMVNADSPANLPRAINNSWAAEGNPDIELFYRAISACEAAGVLPIFSAGNEGEKGNETITPPHEHPLAFAVGSTGETGALSPFSSRGPGQFHGKPTQKPDITAPGEKILSTRAGGGYDFDSGTSLAAPHVTGATAILYQIDPRLTPAQIRNILIQSATPMSSTRTTPQRGTWDPGYGFGKLDIYAAARLAMQAASAREGGQIGLLDVLKAPQWLLVQSIVKSQPEPVANVFEVAGRPQF